jgi:heat-inducible transcriptional repressor
MPANVGTSSLHRPTPEDALVASSAPLSERQGQVLRAVVSSFVGGGAPVASETIAAWLPRQLSPQSVRNTLAELEQLGLVDKPHRSAGRLPTARGLRAFIDQLLAVRELAPYEKRDLAGQLDDAASAGLDAAASRLLSERTRLLGFVVPPALEDLVLRRLSFVRVSSERVLAVVVSEGGRAHQLVLSHAGRGDQLELDRMATSLSDRLAGQSLREARKRLVAEAAALRNRADLLLERVLRDLPLASDASAHDVIVATRLALLDQPEFRDPERVRALLRAVEDKQRLLALLDQVLAAEGVRVAFAAELGAEELDGLAFVAARYGPQGSQSGTLGVIGPRRMDFARVIPLVGYVSRLLSETSPA